MNASEPSSIPSVSDELASAMEWWRDAGVDVDFSDDVTAWLQSPLAEPAQPGSDPAAEGPKSPLLERQEPVEAPAEAASPRIDFFAETRPQSLEEFREFWLNAPGLDAIGPRGRVAPRGQAGAKLMVLVIDPEERDRETLLSGPHGQLLSNILNASGYAQDEVYFASALPRHTPMADTVALAASGLDAVLAHHIALASPKRLMAFGTGLTPLLGQDPSTRDSSLREINYTPPTTDTLVSEGLDSLMSMPRLKARFWRRWIEWTALH